ncbi:putative phage tail component, N-terminal domain-containing protein [Terrisporobacter glycolicus]|nr:putative phage tail component, N-terminal domain-containing protein [Terrisporobacter glycolicus]
MLNYNYANLEEYVKVISIETTLISSRENYSIDIPSRHGEIYNGYKYKSKKIKVKVDVRRSSDEDYRETLNQIAMILDVNGVKPLYIDDSERYYLAIPEGDFDIDKLCKGIGSIEINFICYSPFSISEEVKLFESDAEMINNSKIKRIYVENNGSAITMPLINIGFGNNANFVAITNKTTGQTMMIGNNRNSTTEIVNPTYYLKDEMESTEGWSVGTSWIDTGRNNAGTLTTSTSGQGLTVGDYGGEGTGQWYGTSARKNLEVSAQDFEMKIRCSINSTGINGDPYHVENKTNDDKEMVKTYYLKPSKSCTVRASKSSKGKKLGIITSSYKITKYTTENGWVKFTYKSKTGYVKRRSLRLMAKTKSVTGTAKNFVTLEYTAIRTSPRKSSKNKYTIPTGKVVRCLFTNPISDPDKLDRKYYKLAKKYNGHTGYVAVANLVQASDAEFEWEEELDVADNKQGIVEIYGYASNGTKLFKTMLCDESEYYEHVYPEFFVGSTSIYSYQKTTPAPKKKVTSNGKDTITTDYLLSGRYGSFNEFYGEILVKRVGKTWKFIISKIVDDQTTITKTKTYKTSSYQDELSAVVIYMGARGDKQNTVAVTDVRVKKVNNSGNISNATEVLFQQGDILSVNCEKGRVYHDGKEFYNFDIGSEFIELENGTNEIIVKSDDPEVNSSILFNERWL